MSHPIGGLGSSFLFPRVQVTRGMDFRMPNKRFQCKVILINFDFDLFWERLRKTVVKR